MAERACVEVSRKFTTLQQSTCIEGWLVVRCWQWNKLLVVHNNIIILACRGGTKMMSIDLESSHRVLSIECSDEVK